MPAADTSSADPRAAPPEAVPAGSSVLDAGERHCAGSCACTGRQGQEEAADVVPDIEECNMREKLIDFVIATALAAVAMSVGLAMLWVWPR